MYSAAIEKEFHLNKSVRIYIYLLDENFPQNCVDVLRPSFVESSHMFLLI